MSGLTRRRTGVADVSSRGANRMSAWILRYTGNKIAVGLRSPMTVLNVTNDGQETELEKIEVGGEEYPSLRNLVRSQVDQERPRLILDVSSIERVDSDGIGGFVAVWQHATNTGGEVVLALPQPRVRDLLRILYLDKVIPIFDSVSDAVDYFNRSRD